MELFRCKLLKLVSVVYLLNINFGNAQRDWVTTDECKRFLNYFIFLN